MRHTYDKELKCVTPVDHADPSMERQPWVQCPFDPYYQSHFMHPNRGFITHRTNEGQGRAFVPIYEPSAPPKPFLSSCVPLLVCMGLHPARTLQAIPTKAWSFERKRTPTVPMSSTDSTTKSRSRPHNNNNHSDNSTMDPYKRYSMEESSWSVRSTKSRERSRHASKSLRELDATVAFVGKSYRSPRRPGTDEQSQSSSRMTIATHEHSLHSQQQRNNVKIDNLHHVGGDASIYSSSDYSRVSRRSKSSRRSRRKRGASLERAVSQTILASPSWGEAHFLATSAEDASSVAAESILKDLNEVSSVLMQSEVVSVRSNDTRFRRGREPSGKRLLSPIVSEEEDLNKTIDAVIRGTATGTPPTSGSSSFETAQNRMSVSPMWDPPEDTAWTSGFVDLDTSAEWTTFDTNPFDTDEFFDASLKKERRQVGKRGFRRGPGKGIRA